MAAASLVLFAAGRFAIPYFFIDSIGGNASLWIRAVAQLGTAAIFVTLPTLAADDSPWPFFVLKSLHGLLFAVSAAVAGPMGVPSPCGYAADGPRRRRGSDVYSPWAA